MVLNIFYKMYRVVRRPGC